MVGVGSVVVGMTTVVSLVGVVTASLVGFADDGGILAGARTGFSAEAGGATGMEAETGSSRSLGVASVSGGGTFKLSSDGIFVRPSITSSSSSASAR